MAFSAICVLNCTRIGKYGECCNVHRVVGRLEKSDINTVHLQLTLKGASKHILELFDRGMLTASLCYPSLC